MDDYNGAISILNSKAEAYKNDKLASAARCVGSNPLSPSAESGAYYNTGSYNVRKADTNYEIDYTQMKNLGIVKVDVESGGIGYFMASRQR